MSFVKPLFEIRKSDTAEFGGKAASLGEMLGAGLPVPPGFAISVEGYKLFKSGAELRELEDEVLKNFEDLDLKRVAVRSSAVAEDGAKASWAGQLESYLNVDKSDVLAKIRACWRSMDAERAESYAASHGVGESGQQVGVVVQAMIDSEVSGVMFSVNPVTKDANALMIESAYGLGEMVVQGMVTPDGFIVSKRPLEVLEFNVSIKEKMMVFKNGKNQVVPVPEKLADKTTLKEEQILKLAKIGIRTEAHYGSPQDMEWAFSQGKFYLVQSRPITTL